jgi:hypothetical protein
MLKGGNQTNCLATLSQMFNTMAQKVRVAESSTLWMAMVAVNLAVPLHYPKSSTLENLPLAEEHLVFKRVLLNPGIKCLEIVASINMTKVTAAVIMSMMISLWDTLPIIDLEIKMTSWAAIGYCSGILSLRTLFMMLFFSGFWINFLY